MKSKYSFDMPTNLKLFGECSKISHPILYSNHFADPNIDQGNIKMTR